MVHGKRNKTWAFQGVGSLGISTLGTLGRELPCGVMQNGIDGFSRDMYNAASYLYLGEISLVNRARSENFSEPRPQRPTGAYAGLPMPQIRDPTLGPPHDLGEGEQRIIAVTSHGMVQVIGGSNSNSQRRMFPAAIDSLLRYLLKKRKDPPKCSSRRSLHDFIRNM